MQRINLKDKLTFTEIEKGNHRINNPEVPTDSTNLVYKAWEILKDITGIDKVSM